MADRIDLQHGYAPWTPSAESRLVSTYRYYDCPLSGVIEQHGNEYAFTCLDGETETLSLWVYAPISPEQRERLEELEPDRLAEAWRHEPFAGCLMLAFATERLGIVDVEAVEDSDDPEVSRQRVTEALLALQGRLAGLSEDAKELEVTL